MTPSHSLLGASDFPLEVVRGGSEGILFVGLGESFDQLETFLTAANREIESAFPQYAQFVLERLGVCIQALSFLCHQFEGRLDGEMLEIRKT